MPVTIHGAETPKKKAKSNGIGERISPQKFEVYGRLRLTHSQIAKLEGYTSYQIAPLMRPGPHRQAYDKGRIEAVVAVRQKQLSMALAGDTKLLLHAGEHFADQNEMAEQGLPDDIDPGRHSFDGKLKERLTTLRKNIEGSGSESVG